MKLSLPELNNYNWINGLRNATWLSLPATFMLSSHFSTSAFRHFFTDFGILKDRLEEETDFYVLGKYHASNQIIQQASLFAERRNRAEGGQEALGSRSDSVQC